MTTTNHTEPGQLAEQRVCARCDRPIFRLRGTSYEHSSTAHFDHEAQPKLWHPANADPFAQFVEDEDSDTGFASVENAGEQAEASRTAPTYEVVSKSLPGYNGDAWHIRINGEDFVVSAISLPFGAETMAFRADVNGEVGDLDDVACVRTWDHQAVIDELVAMASNAEQHASTVPFYPHVVAAQELRAMAAKFTESATSEIDEKVEDYGVGRAVRFMYGKAAQELNQRADELAGGAR